MPLKYACTFVLKKSGLLKVKWNCSLILIPKSKETKFSEIIGFK